MNTIPGFKKSICRLIAVGEIPPMRISGPDILRIRDQIKECLGDCSEPVYMLNAQGFKYSYSHFWL
jgi:hypothetical protein